MVSTPAAAPVHDCAAGRQPALRGEDGRCAHVPLALCGPAPRSVSDIVADRCALPAVLCCCSLRTTHFDGEAALVPLWLFADVAAAARLPDCATYNPVAARRFAAACASVLAPRSSYTQPHPHIQP